MAIIRQVNTDTIQIDRSGGIVVRFELCLAEGAVKFDVKHISEAFSPGEDIQARMTEVNAYFATLGYPSLIQTEIDRIIAYSNVV